MSVRAREGAQDCGLAGRTLKIVETTTTGGKACGVVGGLAEERDEEEHFAVDAMQLPVLKLGSLN